jgi:hypothetical protein
MRFISRLALLLLAICGTVSAQQKYNALTQVNWVPLSGSGAPTLPCTASQYGMGYVDVTNSQTYACGMVGWFKTMASPPIVFAGAWNAGSTYTVNQAVGYGGSTYVSLQNSNLNQNPATQTAFWMLLVAGGGSGYFPGSPTVTISGGVTAGQCLIATGAEAANWTSCPGGSTTLTGDVAGSGTGSIVTTLTKIAGVPFCTGFAPTNGQSLQYTTGGSPNPCYSAAAGSGGFPIVLGTTNIPSGSTTTAISGLSVNGVTLQTGGSIGAFLNQAGGYSSPTGISAKVKYVSVYGCPQDTDLTAGGGTDATSCINALWAGASPTNPILVVQDGASLISGNGLQMPASGGAYLQGAGGGISAISLLTCSITSNVATLTTATNTLTAGRNVQFSALSHCPALNNQVLAVSATGISSTSFQVPITSANITSGAETGVAVSAYGTGFFSANNSGDMISNGTTVSGGNCENVAAVPGSLNGASYGISGVIFSGNGGNQSNYCFGADFNNANNIVIENTVFYNIYKYGIKLDNVKQVGIDHVYIYATNVGPTAPINTDGVHIDGPASDITISNSYFHTGDDAIAINSSEGYCGPISRVTITNSTLDNARSALRVYNNGAICANGLSPLIDTVTISNYSGSVYESVATLGFNTIGTLNPAINNLKWANSVVTAVAPLPGAFIVVNNLGKVDLDGFTLQGVSDCLFCSAIGSQGISLLKLHNVTAVFNSYNTGGTGILNILGDISGGGTLTVADAIIDGLGEYNDPGGTAAPGCPLCNMPITNLYAANIDMNLFNSFSSTNVTNLVGLVGSNISMGAGASKFNLYGNGSGFSLLPHSASGNVTHIFSNDAGTTAAFKFDVSNQFLQIGGGQPLAGGSLTSYPRFLSALTDNLNRNPCCNGPALGSVGNWTRIYTPSGTASADCVDWQGQAFGAGGPSSVIKWCNDGSLSLNKLTATSSTTASNFSVPITIGGTVYYMRLSSTP